MTQTRPRSPHLILGVLFALLLTIMPHIALAAPQQVQYAIQFWAEKADYDEGHVQDIGDKYEYLGTKTATGADGEVPDYLATSTENIQFPDVDLDVSSDAQKAKFNKLFHINKSYSKEINADKAGNQRPLTANPTKPRENVYNVFYDREVYEVIFEKGRRSDVYNHYYQRRQDLRCHEEPVHADDAFWAGLWGCMALR